MPEPPRRWRFQVHLSTAVLMMFVSGGVIWANVRPRPAEALGEIIHAFSFKAYPKGTKSEFFQSEGNGIWAGSADNNYGWPLNALFETTPLSLRRDGEIIRSEIGDGRTQYQYHAWWILINVIIATVILFAAWFVFEWLIRRLAARNGD